MGTPTLAIDFELLLIDEVFAVSYERFSATSALRPIASHIARSMHFDTRYDPGVSRRLSAPAEGELASVGLLEDATAGE